MFRPQSFQCLEAATDASGKVTGWKHCVVGDGEFLLITCIKIPYYGVSNQYIERRGVSHGIKLKHWRAVGHVFNTFAIESMVDQMAVEQGLDPIAFRLERMGATPKARNVLEALARMADTDAERPDGRALGISMTERSNSLGAGAVEISLDPLRAKSTFTRSGSRSMAGRSCSPPLPKPMSRAGSSMGSQRCCTSASPSRTARSSNQISMTTTSCGCRICPTRCTSPSSTSIPARPVLARSACRFIAGAISNAVFRLTGKRLRHLPFTTERVLVTLKA